MFNPQYGTSFPVQIFVFSTYLRLIFRSPSRVNIFSFRQERFSITRAKVPLIRLISPNIRKSKIWLQLQMYYLSDGKRRSVRGKRNWFLHNLSTKTSPWDLSVALKTKHSFVFYYFRRNRCIFYKHVYSAKWKWFQVFPYIFKVHQVFFLISIVGLTSNNEDLIPFDVSNILFKRRFRYHNN